MRTKFLAYIIGIAATVSVLIFFTREGRRARGSSPVPTLSFVQSPPGGWVRYGKSMLDALDIQCANLSSNVWEVSFDGQHLAINEARPGRKQDPLPFGIPSGSVTADRTASSEIRRRAGRHVQRTTDGWVVGFNAGEWGGSLWWFDREGAKGNKLLDENIVGLIGTSTGDEVLVLTGFAHEDEEEGRVVGAKKDEKKEWHAVVVAELGEQPQAYLKEGSGSILILTHTRLLRVKRDGRIDVLAQVDFRRLGPNSIVVMPSGVIHVGMNHFVATLTPTGRGYDLDWLVTENCKRFEVKGLECVCLE